MQLPGGYKSNSATVSNKGFFNRLFTGTFDAQGNAFCDANLSVLGDTNVSGLLRTNRLKIYSDRRLKTDIKSLDDDNVIYIVENLTPVKFRYRSDTRRYHTGFIAQEVKMYFPDAVNGNYNDFLSIDPMALTALLFRYVQIKNQRKTWYHYLFGCCF